MTIQKLWDTEKAMLRGKFIGIKSYLRKQEKFKIKTVTRDKEGHYIMIKGLIQNEYVTIVNIYVPK